MELTRVDRRILQILDGGVAGPLSTYQIAKKADVSWSTAILHCYKLMASGLIDGKETEIRFGYKNTFVWWKR